MAFGENNAFVTITLAILFIILMMIGKKIKHANIFAPWIITPTVWLCIIVLYLFGGNMLRSLSSKFYICLFLWVTSLSVTSMVVFANIKQKECNMHLPNRVFYNNFILRFLIILSVILTPFYFYIIFKSLNGDFTNIFLRLRDKAVTGGYDLGLLGYIETLNFVLLIIAFYVYPRVSKKTIAYLLTVNFLTGFAIMEKGTFFEIILTIIFVYFIKKRISTKTIVYTIIGFMLAMVGFQFLRSGSDDVNIVHFFTLYILSPSAAFDTLTITNSPQIGLNTFSFYYKVINAIFGTDFVEVPMLKDFVNVPMHVNVYTVMQPYYEDFGYIGVFIFGMINGIMSGYIFKKSLSGKLIWICSYTFICEYFILQFFQERLFVSHSDFIQIILFAYLISLPKLKFYYVSKQKHEDCHFNSATQ